MSDDIDAKELREFERQAAARYLKDIGADRPIAEQRARHLRLAEGCPVYRVHELPPIYD